MGATPQAQNLTFHYRSWNSCTRCEKSKQKCDERTPTWSRCQNTGEQCVYLMSSSQVGRSFWCPRFGIVLVDTRDDIVRLSKLGNEGLLFSECLSLSVANIIEQISAQTVLYMSWASPCLPHLIRCQWPSSAPSTIIPSQSKQSLT
jgi:hypothetical protein